MKNLRLMALMFVGFAALNLSVRAEEAEEATTKVVEISEDAALIVDNAETKEVTVVAVDDSTKVVVITETTETEAAA